MAFTVAVYGLPKFPSGRLVDVIFSRPRCAAAPANPDACHKQGKE